MKEILKTSVKSCRYNEVVLLLSWYLCRVLLYKFCYIIGFIECNCHYIVDGAWSSWASYGPCSVTCEGGIRNRERLCDDPAPAWGGAECPGESSETGTCNHNNCDGMLLCSAKWAASDIRTPIIFHY